VQETTHSPVEQADLREMVGHNECVQAEETLEEVHKRFAQHQFEFMAVMDGPTVLGICSRQQIGMVLGARFGFSLYSRSPVREFLVKQMTGATVGQPISDVLTKVFSRSEETLFDDVVLLDEQGRTLGLIFARTLVRLQHALVREKIQQLEKRQREINQKNEQLEDDLRLAHEIQLALLPDEFLNVPLKPAEHESSLRFYHRYKPAGLVSGDFFHVLRISDDSVGVFICDVMGHGVRSAFITAMLRALVEELRQFGEDPGELLTHVNGELKAILKQVGNPMFATAFYLVADVRRGNVRFARAVHPPPLQLNRRTGEVKPLCCLPGTEGPALGVFPTARYGNSSGSLDASDCIFLFTDGLYEVFDAASNEFGRERLTDAIHSRCAMPLQQLVDDVFGEVLTHSVNHEFEDDVCLVGMEICHARHGVSCGDEAAQSLFGSRVSVG
jgi:serine phosphatase RsbU (regulator of sigma subunit)